LHAAFWLIIKSRQPIEKQIEAGAGKAAQGKDENV